MNQLDPRAIARRLLRRKWIILLGLVAGLAGGGATLLTQKRSLHYLATAKLVSSEASQAVEEPTYLWYPQESNELSKMVRVAATILSPNFLEQVAVKSGILYWNLKVNGKMKILHLRVDTQAEKGQYSLEIRGGRLFLRGPKGELSGPLGDTLRALGVECVARGEEGARASFEVVEPELMAGAIKYRLRLNISGVEHWAGKLTVEGGEPGSQFRVLTVRLEWPEPLGAVRLVSAIAKEAIEANLREKRTQYAQSKEFISKQLADYSRKLEELADRMRRFKEREGIADLDQERAAAAQRLGSLDAEMAQVDVELNYIKEARSWLSGEGNPPEYAMFLIEDPQIQSLFETVLTEETKLEAALESLGDSHPRVRELRAQLEAHRTKLGELLGQRERALVKRKKALLNLRKTEEAKLQGLMTGEVTLAQMERQREALEDMYYLFTEKYEDIRIKEAGVTPDISILELPKAARPVSTGPKGVRVLLVGLLVGLILGIAAGMLVDYLDDTITSTDDVETVVGARVLGSVPVLDEEAPMALISGVRRREDLLGRGSYTFEVFRIIALNMGLVGAEAKVRAVGITSPLPGEGKTTIAANLGASLAVADLRVLVVDADVRNRGLTRVFAEEGKPGLFEFLGGEPAERCTHRTRVEGLFVMPIGKSFADPIHIFSSQAFADKLQHLLELYDRVIFDAAPVVLADAGVLSARLDGVAMVAKAGETSMRILGKGIAFLRDSGARVLGVIVNMSQEANQERYYRYYAQRPSKGLGWFKLRIPWRKG